MKKLIIGLVAVGALLAARPALKRKAREHCQQMAAKCKEKMARFGASEETGIPAHCKEMATTGKEKMAEHPEPTPVGNGDRSEALSTA